jgi:hypothetical protein
VGFRFNKEYLPCFRSPQPVPDRSSRWPKIGKGYLGKFYIQKVEEGLITVLGIPIIFKGRKPCNGIAIRNLELGPDEGGKQIRLVVDQLLDLLLASLYRRDLGDTWHGLLPNNLFLWRFRI